MTVCRLLIGNARSSRLIKQIKGRSYSLVRKFRCAAKTVLHKWAVRVFPAVALHVDGITVVSEFSVEIQNCISFDVISTAELDYTWHNISPSLHIPYLSIYLEKINVFSSLVSSIVAESMFFINCSRSGAWPVSLSVIMRPPILEFLKRRKENEKETVC